MEAPLVADTCPSGSRKPWTSRLGVAVISLQCVWLASLQCQVADLKGTIEGLGLAPGEGITAAGSSSSDSTHSQEKRLRTEARTQELTAVDRAGSVTTLHNLAEAPDSLSDVVASVGGAPTSFEYLTMGPNLVSNSFMNNLNGQRPHGYYHYCILRRSPWTREYGVTPICMMSVSAVHPYTQCFEGPLCGDCAAQYPNAARTCEEATEERPYIFGRYTMGPRSGRGGLSGGWGGFADGKILRIQGVRDADWTSAVFFPAAKRVQTDRVLFRAFLKIISGKASIQSDIGTEPDPEMSASASAAAVATNGWLAIHKLVDSHGGRTTRFSSDVVFKLNVYGEDDDQTGAFEMYLALPYMANVVEKLSTDGQQSVAWVGSVEDQMVDHGFAAWENDRLQLNFSNARR